MELTLIHSHYLVVGVVQCVHFRLDVLQVGSRGFSLEDYFVHRN